MDQELKYVLILGGSTFMGKDLLQKLSQRPNLQIHYINRGKKYWNNDVKNIPNINFTFGNRKENQDFTKLLKYLSKKIGITEESNKKWDLVVDFSAFKRRNVKSVYNGLNKLLKLYVLISTDSIYDVCDEKVRNLPNIVEEFAIRPQNPNKIKKNKKDEDYGHDKLKCEEFLHAIKEKQDFPFIILRLADVIGPFDDTGRFWAYILWMRYYSKYPIEMEDEDIKHKMSFVYGPDVADLIIRLFTWIGTDKLSQKNLYQSYNLAFEENVNLPELLKLIADSLKLDIQCKVMDDTNNTYYPSVECGPLDIHKAKNLLAWKPIALDLAILECIVFFLKAENTYQEEFKDAFRKLPRYIKEFQYQQNKKVEENLSQQKGDHEKKVQPTKQSSQIVNESTKQSEGNDNKIISETTMSSTN